jgi:hypothetical protein
MTRRAQLSAEVAASEDRQEVDFIRNPSAEGGLSTGLIFTTRSRGWKSADTVIVVETE